MHSPQKKTSPYFYLPAASKIGNRLIVKRMTTPITKNIQFTDKKTQKCHDYSNFMNKNNQKYRYYTNRDSFNILALGNNQKQGHKRKQKFNKNQQSHQQAHGHTQPLRISFSRMMEKQGKQQTNWSYLTHFYKKPIQKQIQLRKNVISNSKNKQGSLNQALKISQCRPETSMENPQNTLLRKKNPRCRCHHKSHEHELNRPAITKRIVVTSQNTRPKTQRHVKVSQIAKPAKIIFSKRNIQKRNEEHENSYRKEIGKINNNDSWVVDSWNNQQSKMIVNESSDCIFKNAS